MKNYRKSSHSVYQLHYHFVFVTKYRKPVLVEEIGLALRQLVRQICRSMDIYILAGNVRSDHVHLLLSVPPHIAPSEVMQAVKGKTSNRLLANWRRLRSQFWGQHLWARGYFVCTS